MYKSKAEAVPELVNTEEAGVAWDELRLCLCEVLEGFLDTRPDIKAKVSALKETPEFKQRIAQRKEANRRKAAAGLRAWVRMRANGI